MGVGSGEDVAGGASWLAALVPEPQSDRHHDWTAELDALHLRANALRRSHGSLNQQNLFVLNPRKQET